MKVSVQWRGVGVSSGRAFPLADERVRTVLVTFAIVLGVAVRAIHALHGDFPLNDGGLFYVMAEEIQASHYALPTFTRYNEENIPFAYPPLGLYAAALAADVSPFPLLQVFQFLPLFVNALVLVAFYLLARSLLSSEALAIMALVAFALIPRSFIWLIMGGGVTRAFGFLFAILALYHMHRFCEGAQWRHVGYLTMFAALTVLSHLGTAPFLAFSLVIMAAFFGRRRDVLGAMVAAGIGSLIVTAPWWLVVIHHHGIGPFQAARASGGSIFSNAEALRSVLGLVAYLGVGTTAGAATGETLFPLLGTLALFGLLNAVVSGQWFLPTWWAATIVLDSRAGITYATLPIAMLAARGVVKVLFPALRILWHNASPGGAPGAVTGTLRFSSQASRLGLTLAALLLMYSTASASMIVPSLMSQTRALVALSPSERAAMEWVRSHTPQDSRFLVVPESQWSSWQTDKTSEWFPALAQRRSVATVQGSEWLGGGTFDGRQKAFKELRECAAGVADCLEEWARQHGESYTYVYIPQPPLREHETYLVCCKLLIRSLDTDPGFRRIYDGPGAVIFQRQ